jgi:hypothetical protein
MTSGVASLENHPLAFPKVERDPLLREFGRGQVPHNDTRAQVARHSSLSANFPETITPGKEVDSIS